MLRTAKFGLITVMYVAAVLIYEGMWAFDFGVAVEVWGIDRTDAGGPAFELRRCSVECHTVDGDSGFSVRATHDLEGLRTADLILAPGRNDDTAPIDPRIADALREAVDRGVPVVGMCGGAFTLAQAGILNGRRATTHWLLIEQMRELFPAVRVEPEDLYIEDHGIWTSAGTASLIDLCLHLVRITQGAKAATLIAHRMVTPPHRSGNQRPYIDTPLPPDHQTPDPLATVIDWAKANLQQRLTDRQLAEMAHMSERTFTRRFTQSTGATPQQWLRHQRLLQAQHLLENTRLSIQTVALRTGFGSPALFRRHFTTHFSTTPTAYRREFQDSPDED